MPEIILTASGARAQKRDASALSEQSAHARLLSSLEDALAMARPRLTRLARLHGVDPDAADDVAQETLLEAWRSLDHLRKPARFDAWLDGICRNVCRRWARARGADELPLAVIGAAHPEGDDATADLAEPDLLDPQALDPAEELSRQDLAVLLDRALSHLSENARQALEMCYLAELPQREAALRLGLTIGALELRLHRARRQLRRVLSGALREDAEAFGLLLDDAPSAGWRDTRLWCHACGRQHQRAAFETMPDGRINFRLRCPVCSPQQDIDITNSSGWIDLHGLRSVRPALKLVDQTCYMRHRQVLTGGVLLCPDCQQPMRWWLGYADELDLRLAANEFYSLLACPRQHFSISSALNIAAWGHTVVERFKAEHPRWVSEPDVLAEYAGHPALRFRLTNLASASRLTIFAQYPTLRILGVFQD